MQVQEEHVQNLPPKGRKLLEDGIYNYPVEFFKTIKQCALNYQESRHKILVILDGFTKIFGSMQNDQERLQDYTRIFKTLYEVLQLHIGGTIQIQKFVKTSNEFTNDPDSKDELLINEQLTKQVINQLVSFVYLQNADKLKYCSILKFFNLSKVLKNDEQPNTMLEAKNVLSNNHYDNVNKIKHNKK